MGCAGISTGPWGKKVVSVEGVELSLDDIEHKILRAIWHDPRVHYAVNCASVGCPNLARTAFTGARLEAMLEAGARAFVNHPRGIEVKNGKVTTSSIYDWYEKDFGGSEKAVLDHVRHYASPELAQQIKNAKKVAAYQYDWRLNDSSDHGS